MGIFIPLSRQHVLPEVFLKMMQNGFSVLERLQICRQDPSFDLSLLLCFSTAIQQLQVIFGINSKIISVMIFSVQFLASIHKDRTQLLRMYLTMASIYSI